MPSSSVRSAVRAALLADRTEPNVATASTNVPPAVASEEIVAHPVASTAPDHTAEPAVTPNEPTGYAITKT